MRVSCAEYEHVKHISKGCSVRKGRRITKYEKVLLLFSNTCQVDAPNSVYKGKFVNPSSSYSNFNSELMISKFEKSSKAKFAHMEQTGSRFTEETELRARGATSAVQKWRTLELQIWDV